MHYKVFLKEIILRNYWMDRQVNIVLSQKIRPYLVKSTEKVKATEMVLISTQIS